MTAAFSWVNHIDASATVLSTDSETGSLTVSNVADTIIGRRHRLTSLTGYGQADFGSNKTVGILALRFPRDTSFPLAGTVRWRLDADGGTPGTGAAYDSTAISIGAADGYGYHLHVPGSNVTARYVRWTFAASGVSFVDVGRVWAGEIWQPTYDVEGGYDDEWDDLSRITASARSGARFVDERPRQRMMAFQLGALDSTERDNVREFQRIAGMAKQTLFCLDPSSFAKETMIGRIGKTTPIKHRNLSVNLYTKAFVIEEDL